ncbi:MAG: M1 family aminopeptidase [Terriglobales bacterium]
MRCTILVTLLSVLLVVSAAVGQELSSRPQASPAPPAPTAPNSDPTYQQLRQSQLGDVTLAVHDLVLQRDAGTFTFRSGTFSFLAPVNGKVTGAVFLGEGTFTLVPPTASEQHSLSLLTKEPRMEESFNELVLRFTDGTADEIKKAGTAAAAAGNPGAALQRVNSGLRTELHYNLHARLLEDVLGTKPGGLFVAFIKGKKYDSRMIYALDPRGVHAFGMGSDQAGLMTWDENKHGVWASFRLAQEHDQEDAARRNRFKISHQKLNTTFEKGGRLDGDATTTIAARSAGLRVVHLDLFPSLRAQSVSDSGGHPLSFIQESKDEDPGFAVILPRALEAGEEFTIRTIYSGKDAVKNEGGDNYYPVSGARDSWFPSQGLGQYASYEMTFHIPKGMAMVATGNRLREVNEGNENLSAWRSDVPQAIAGFNFGRFKRKEAKIEKLDFVVESYANQDEPDIVKLIAQGAGKQVEVHRDVWTGQTYSTVTENAAVGTLTTTGMMDKALAEGQLAVELYTDYFGPTSYKRLAMTQHSAFNYGQSWPTLVYLPITYFFDSTARHGLHMDDPRGYFKVVGPHEVAHQWWGHTVGFDNYRDQWMSEGFADFSASLFIQAIQKSNSEFIKFWNDEREMLTETNKEGFRAIDVGPVTQGHRLNNTKAGFDVSRRLIYAKGAYILHMIRMMMWNAKTGDSEFKSMMQDFVRTYANRPATTEDFKAMVEKHMTPGMDMSGNHTMDWYFDEYVYGTALPSYKLDYSLDQAANGYLLSLKITQSGVDDKFTMPVPVYLELSKDHIVRLGAASITGNRTIEQKVPLNGLKEKPKRAMLNYFNDVLCAP